MKLSAVPVMKSFGICMVASGPRNLALLNNVRNQRTVGMSGAEQGGLNVCVSLTSAAIAMINTWIVKKEFLRRHTLDMR